MIPLHNAGGANSQRKVEQTNEKESVLPHRKNYGASGLGIPKLGGRSSRPSFSFNTATTCQHHVTSAGLEHLLRHRRFGDGEKGCFSRRVRRPAIVLDWHTKAVVTE